VPATLTIREVRDGLSIRVTEPRRTGRILLTLAGGIGMAAFVYYAKFDFRLLELFFLGIVAVSLIRDVLSTLRGTDVELRVTNLDFLSTGRAPAGYKSSSIPSADIYNLKFEEAMSGDYERPSGLYAEHHGIFLNPTTCILPHIDEAQTEQVIDAIYRRFPDTAHSANSEPYLTSLNLNRSTEIPIKP
jgi:hypothetical protein